MYVIYWNARDNPGVFVLRRHVVNRLGERADREPIVISSTLEKARAHVPPGAYNMGRMPGDEPQIVEVWL